MMVRPYIKYARYGRGGSISASPCTICDFTHHSKVQTELEAIARHQRTSISILTAQNQDIILHIWAIFHTPFIFAWDACIVCVCT